MFLIRENAMKILVDVYKHCDKDFQMKPFHSEKYNLNTEDFTKSLKYLQQSGYIENVESFNPDFLTITIKGIDKAEDIILDEQE